MVTRLPRPFVAAWNVFVRHENAREAVPGMARLYAELRSGDQDVPVVYLSTGAWNAAPTLARFLRRHRYPAGPLLLTDWGPTNSGWFRSGPGPQGDPAAPALRPSCPTSSGSSSATTGSATRRSTPAPRSGSATTSGRSSSGS